MTDVTPATPPVFVINLPRDNKRKDVMRERFDKCGVQLTFIEAVNGRELDLQNAPYYDRARRRRYFGRDLMPGEIGCLLSHRKIFEKIVAEKIPYAVVLEDDVIPEPDFRQAIEALPLAVIKWDVIRFLGSKKIYQRGCRKIAPLAGRYWLARLPTAPGGAHGYMLTLHAAGIMLHHMQKNWVPIDTLQGRMWETGLETLVLNPAPVQTDQAMESTIGDARMDKTILIEGLERVLFPLNRALYKLGDTCGKRFIYWSSWPRDYMVSKKQTARS